jgi:hypothetical protein
MLKNTLKNNEQPFIFITSPPKNYVAFQFLWTASNEIPGLNLLCTASLPALPGRITQVAQVI